MQNNNSTSTFAEFLENHSVQIPLIQRDYVQGRFFDAKSKEKRDTFIDKLLTALLKGERYNLDFIYGARENYGNNKSMTEAPFLPLDGQQRLTTLFLLHWTLLQKSKDSICDFRGKMQLLQKFSYKTRISSGRFCQKLTDNQFESCSLIEQIRNKHWYDNDMKTDPTIIAMMQMLELLEEKLDTEQYKPHCKDMCDELFSEKLITFEMLDMEQYNLTDGLYVKMNARGKQLTEFENWKASFIGMLNDIDLNLKKRFERGIEHEWNDVFWTDAYRKYSNAPKDASKKKYPRIDESFMNFFNNFSRILYFATSTNKDPKADDFLPNLWSVTQKLFSEVENVSVLFDILDRLYLIHHNYGLKKFFEDIFYTQENFNLDDKSYKVRLFIDPNEKQDEDTDNTNLFVSICKSDSFKTDHLLFYAIMVYCIKYDKNNVDVPLCNYVRFCRNYLEELNYFNHDKIEIVPQVRVNEMQKHKIVFDYFAQDEDFVSGTAKNSKPNNNFIDRELEKLPCYETPELATLMRKLEDLSITHGNLTAFAFLLWRCQSEPDLIKVTWNAIDDFVKAKPLTRVQIFIALGYQGLDIKGCDYGRTVFLGDAKVHFRKNGKNLSSWISELVRKYSEGEDIVQIISNKTNSNPTSLSEYMLKYPAIISAGPSWTDSYYYAMSNGWSNLDILAVKVTRSPQRAYQVCPMAYAVAQKMANKSYVGYAGYGSGKTGLYIISSSTENCLFELKIDGVNWVTAHSSYIMSLPPKLKNAFNQQCQLVPVPGKDLIELATDFMDEVIEHFGVTKLKRIR